MTIKFEQSTEWNPHTAEDTEHMIFTYPKSDRYMMSRIRHLVMLLVDKRNTEEELQKEIHTILDECMKDYYGELE